MKSLQLTVATLAILNVTYAEKRFRMSKGAAVAMNCNQSLPIDANHESYTQALAQCGYENTKQGSRARKGFNTHLIQTLGISEEDIQAAIDQFSNLESSVKSSVSYSKTNYKREWPYFSSQTDIQRALNLGAGLLGYWGVLILLGTLYNFLTKVSFVQGSSLMDNSLARKLRKHIGMPALFGERKTDRFMVFGVFGGFIPSRLQSLIILVATVLLAIFEGVSLDLNLDGLDSKTKTIQITGFLGDRSASLAIFLMVAVFLFGGRNNVFIWLTGWKRSTFVTFHRWVGRLFAVAVLIHGVSEIVNMVNEDSFSSLVQTTWIRFGLTAFSATILMTLSSFSFIRANVYEIFLYTHIALAIAFMYAAWHHLADGGRHQYAYACVAVWAFDWLVRVFKIANFGGPKSAIVEAISDETLRITIPKRSGWKTFPGSYSYIYFLTPLNFFQSHPFSIVEDANGKYIHFYTKIKKGVTKRMYNKVIAEGGSTTIKVLVEGAYGNHKQLNRYDNALLYAGGNGIPSLFAYARELAESKTFVKLYWVIRHWQSLDWFMDELIELSKVAPQTSVTIYVSKGSDNKFGEKMLQDANSSTGSFIKENLMEDKSFDGMRDAEMREATEANTKSNFLMVPQANHNRRGSDASSIALDRIKELLPNVQFVSARPDFELIVASDLHELSGSTAVMMCAHSTMNDTIRKTVARNLDQVCGRVDLFEESQYW